jgi:lipid II:glycine glycyltransferase (peptidoglycan interpeptide bridge formation enzyme)
MRALDDGFRIEVDQTSPEAWYELAASFEDANLYQLWSHGAGPERFTRISRAVIKKDDQVVAAAELRLFRLPLWRRGIAYMLWGPLVRRGDAIDVQTFRQTIRALRNEYVDRRGMVLRITPRLVQGRDDELLSVLAEEGLTPLELKARQSLVVDLRPSSDELRRDLDKKWRNCLSKAEKSDLTIVAGTSREFWDNFVAVYERLLQRKQFAPSADIEKHRRVQEALPALLKLHIVLAKRDDAVCAGAVYSALGDTAVYLFGATDDVGMRWSASYLVQWHIMQALKAQGVKYYDLNGIDPAENPGTYHFKRGLAGKRTLEVTFARQFQAADDSLGTAWVLFVEKLQRRMRIARLSRSDRSLKGGEADASADTPVASATTG